MTPLTPTSGRKNQTLTGTRSRSQLGIDEGPKENKLADRRAHYDDQTTAVTRLLLLFTEFTQKIAIIHTKSRSRDLVHALIKAGRGENIEIPTSFIGIAPPFRGYPNPNALKKRSSGENWSLRELATQIFEESRREVTLPAVR